MNGDRERWDTRFSKEDAKTPRAPDARVIAAIAALVPAPRTALELAAGSGRHSLWLAARGIETEAWDVSPVGLSLCAERAQSAGLALVTREVDLSADLPKSEPRNLVLVVDFLDRALLASLHASVAHGGVAIVSTFTDDFPGEQPSARFRLRPGELRALAGLITEHRDEAGGRVTLVARKP